MKLDEAEVMAFPRKLVEHAILGLYDQINLHLVKLAGFDFPESTREHFRRDEPPQSGQVLFAPGRLNIDQQLLKGCLVSRGDLGINRRCA